jgi:hypothetical protein
LRGTVAEAHDKVGMAARHADKRSKIRLEAGNFDWLIDEGMLEP